MTLTNVLDSKLKKKKEWDGMHEEYCTKWVNDEGCECWNPATKKSKIGYMGTSGTEMSDHDY